MEQQRIESMLSQLIKMVGAIQADQQEMKQEMQGLKEEQQEMKREMQGMKAEMKEIREKVEELDQREDKRYYSMLAQLKAIRTDQNFIWEKAVRNEREIANIKGNLN